MKPIYLSPRVRTIIIVLLVGLPVLWLILGWPRLFERFPAIHRALSAPTFQQSAYRFFANSDSTNPDSSGVGPLAAQDTAVTLGTLGQAFRLRALLHIGVETLTRWTTTAVDSTGTIGQYTSLAAPNSQTIFISYYDATAANLDLKFAKSTNRGSSWTTSTIDTTGDVGQYTSIKALDTNTIIVSYYDLTNGDLKFAKSTNGGTSWTTSTVDSTGNVGQYTSIGFADSNTLYISYYDVTNGDLKVAKSTNGGTSWTSQTVESLNDTGQYTAIKIRDANTVYIAFYNVTNADQWFAKTPNGGTSWTNSAIQTGADDRGRYMAIDAPDNNTIYVSYYRVDIPQVAKSTNAGSSWSFFAPDGVTAPPDRGSHTSLVATDTTHVYLTFRDNTNGDVRFVWTDDGGTNWNSSELLDGTGVDVGQYTSLAVVNTANMFISYYDVTNGDLKFAAVGGSQTFKLQFAQRGSDNSCDTSFTGETYADVTTTSTMAYYNNATPADGDPAVSSINNPSHSGHPNTLQTYEEANTFTNVTQIVANEDALWDFALFDNSGQGGVPFCFRMVKSNNSLLDTYSVIPQATTGTNLPPNRPTSLTQKRSDTQATISTGGWVNTSGLRYEASVTDPDSGQETGLCVIIRTLAGTVVRDQCGTVSSMIPKHVTINPDIIPEGSYRWEGYGQDSIGGTSSTQCFPDPSCNSDSDRDFGIDLSAPTSSGAVVNDGTGSDIETQTSTSILSANWSGFSDAQSGISRYEYRIVRASDGRCWDQTTSSWVSCTAWVSNGTATSFTVTAPDGTFAVGETYSVSVRGVDAVGYTSPTVSSNSVKIVSAPPSPPPPPPRPPPSASVPPASPTTFTTKPSSPDSGSAPAPSPSLPQAVTPPPSPLQSLQQALQESPVSQAISQVTPIAAPATAATGLLVAIAQFLSGGPLYLAYLWTALLEYLGIRRRRRSWGVVYNAATKEPLPLIVVQLVEAGSGRVVEQRVTDQLGRFGFLVQAGTYQLRPMHPAFRFPSQISPGRGDFRYSDLYHGEELTVSDPSTTLAVNIPLDPLTGEEQAATPSLSRLPVLSFRRASAALLILSLLLQGFVAVVRPSALNIGLLALYLLMLLASRKLMSRRPKSWAVVYDSVTKEEVQGAEIYMTEEGNPRFSSRKVTDQSGRVYLLLPPGKYHLFVQHPAYHFPIAADQTPGYRGEAIEVTADRPLIHLDIPVEKSGVE